MSSFIDTIREKGGGLFLKRQLKKIKHQPTVYNLQSAATAGILFDASQAENIAIVKGLMKELKAHQITSKSLGYIHQNKRDDDYIGDDVHSFACKKDFSFFYKPKLESVQTFIQTPFSLLFVLTKDNSFPIDYIGSLSRAAFKAGKANVNNDMLDIMIELKTDDDLKDLKNQIIHYLSILNTGDSQSA